MAKIYLSICWNWYGFKAKLIEIINDVGILFLGLVSSSSSLVVVFILHRNYMGGLQFRWRMLANMFTSNIHMHNTDTLAKTTVSINKSRVCKATLLDRNGVWRFADFFFFLKIRFSSVYMLQLIVTKIYDDPF